MEPYVLSRWRTADNRRTMEVREVDGQWQLTATFPSSGEALDAAEFAKTARHEWITEINGGQQVQ